jgi:4-alpha-glucanotransferase
MAAGARRALRLLAERHGVLPAYTDATGVERPAPDRTLLALLDRLGVSLDRPSEAAERLRSEALDARGAYRHPPVAIGEPGRPVRVPFDVPWGEPFPRRWGARLQREGAARERPIELSGRPPSGRRGFGGALELPRRLPPGYHELRLDPPGGAVHLIVAPRRLPALRPRSSWGVFVPLYALWDARGLGCGDLTTLRELVRWAGRLGAGWVGTLPLLSSFLGRPFEPSPYRPVSRRFWNELYLDPTRSGPSARTSSPEPVREYLDLRAVAAARRERLAARARAFGRRGGAARDRLRRWLAEDPERSAYARFRARGAAGTARRSELFRYHAYAQWRMSGELHAIAREAGRLGVGLYLDLPVGIHPDGFDAASAEDAYVPGVEMGSPPDPGYPEGQRWGIPPPHPERMRAGGYRALRGALRAHFEVARALRLDHVMGLHRLFWVPDGFAPRDGGYVRYAAEEQYAVVLLEASRAGAVVVGEDLGTVPPEVRPALARRGLLRSYVAQLEWDSPRGGRPAPIPSNALASLNNHDMLPFAAYWEDRAGRPAARSASSARIWGPHGAPAREALGRALERLGESSAPIVLVSLEDLWGEKVPQNTPGSPRPERNFRRRARMSIEALSEDPDIARLLTRLDAARRRAARRRDR